MLVRDTHKPRACRALLALAAGAMLISAIGPAAAEGNTATATSPPSLNASQGTPQSENSLPENAETATINRPGVVQTRPRPASR